MLILTGLLLAGLVWFVYGDDARVTALRNLLNYRAVKALGGPRMLHSESRGGLAGRIVDSDGQPLAGAVALVASPLGHTYTAQSDPADFYCLSPNRNGPPKRANGCMSQRERRASLAL